MWRGWDKVSELNSLTCCHPRGIPLALIYIMIAFGPIPSRRLGRSLGINNIPHKLCSFNCVYCQLGRTLQMQTERAVFYDPETVIKEVTEHVTRIRAQGEPIDYLTFVPDGEPTLDIHLGREIEMLKGLGIKIAVITNASLIWKSDVREDLNRADWVSLKVDSVRDDLWRKINRPHRSLRLTEILQGMLTFAKEFQGKLVTETMLVKGLNDTQKNAAEIAEFLVHLKPSCAYLLIPTRPPGEEWVEPPEEEIVLKLYQVFKQQIPNVEYLIGYEGSAFSSTGNIEQDLLNITAVHPMREDAVKDFIDRSEASWSVVEQLTSKGLLCKTEYLGRTFYMRKFAKQKMENGNESFISH